jgi:hypothetical protein
LVRRLRRFSQISEAGIHNLRKSADDLLLLLITTRRRIIQRS